MSLIAMPFVIMSVVNGFERQMLLLTTTELYCLFHGTNITYFTIVCSLYFHSVYMEGHIELDHNYLYQHLTTF